MWGNPARKDSLDSIAKLDTKALKADRKVRRTRRSNDNGTTVRNRRAQSSSSSSSSGTARVTVRRQRH